MTQPTTVTAGSLDVPDATLHYEVRGSGPLVVLVGAPMDAAHFAPLADLLATDHTVLTTDPRGINRSRLTDPGQDSTPRQRADDLSRLLTHLDAGPAAVLGSSGGAVSALALTEAHPEQVHTVIAHEPPLLELLDDRDQLRRQTAAMIATYQAGDVLGAWAQFMAQANIELPPGALEMMFGGDRDPQAVADERFWFDHEMVPTISWQPDVAVLRAVPTRVVIGVGEESGGQICERTSAALGALLDVGITRFPGDHIGFVEDAERFGSRLRAVLDERG
jgi:pimeloyl-ACP methyl ester carboxylesterase